MATPLTIAHTLRPIRTLWFLLLLAAAVAIVTFVAVAGQRIGYPFELEWMEGALVDHAARVANGQPLYCAPTPEHVPFLYAPLQFWLGGALIACGMDGLLALRLIGALASVGIAMLLGHWVRKETGRISPGIAASGLFLAGYGWLHWWFDLARNDSPFLLAILLCAYVLRHGCRRRWLPAAALAVIALLAKQSALMWLPAIGVGALIQDWRNGLRFGVAGVLGILLAVGIMHWSSSGWSTFYLFEMPRYHGWVAENRLGFWWKDLWPMYPLLVLAVLGFVARCRDGRARDALFLAAVGSGGIVTSWFSRMHVGGFDNVLMYGFAIACVLGPVAATTRRFGRMLPALLVAQFAILFWIEFRPARIRMALPTQEHRQAHEELAAYVQAQPGDVFLPGHGLITSRTGKATSAHGQAIFDLMQTLPRTAEGGLDFTPLVLGTDERMSPRAREAMDSFYRTMLDAIARTRFSAIVFARSDGKAAEELFRAAFGMFGPDRLEGTADDLYQRREEPLLTNPRALRPPIGHRVHSPYAFEAR